MTDRTDRQELQILRVGLARVAQAMGTTIAREIPGSNGRTDLGYSELAALALDESRGWNRLCACMVDHVLEQKAALSNAVSLRRLLANAEYDESHDANQE
jgi:hypothetical protein